VSSNLVAKMKGFACAIPHGGSIASWLLPVVLALAAVVAVAVAVTLVGGGGGGSGRR
jgi:hypothetical protein